MHIFKFFAQFVLWASVVSAITFDYTGDYQTWTVPANVASIRVTLYGASAECDVCNGGKGGMMETDIPVTPGEILRIYVGGQGDIQTNLPGFNGGGLSSS